MREGEGPEWATGVTAPDGEIAVNGWDENDP